MKLSEMLKVAPTPSFAEATQNHFNIGVDGFGTDEGCSMT
jgi:hypothetical protein